MPEEQQPQPEAEVPVTSESLDAELQKQLDLLNSENLKLKDQLLRSRAEFENYRKRNDRDLGQLIQNANSDLVSRLLPSLDDLDLILANMEATSDPAALINGIRLFQKNLFKILQDEGLQPMNAVGQEFDPEYHDALLHIDVEDTESNKVVEEHKKGYLFKDRILRHAQVVVSK